MWDENARKIGFLKFGKWQVRLATCYFAINCAAALKISFSFFFLLRHASPEVLPIPRVVQDACGALARGGIVLHRGCITLWRSPRSHNGWEVVQVRLATVSASSVLCSSILSSIHPVNRGFKLLGEVPQSGSKRAGRLWGDVHLNCLRTVMVEHESGYLAEYAEEMTELTGQTFTEVGSSMQTIS